MPSIPSNETVRGLLVSWFLVGLPATSGFLVFFVGGRPSHKTVGNAIAVGLFWALVTTAVVGTALFGIVRGGLLLQSEEVTWADRFLLGRDRAASGRWLLGISILSTVIFLSFAVQKPELIADERTVLRGIGTGTLVMHTGVLSLIAVVHSYRNDGLLVGWALVGLPMFALLLIGLALPLDPRPTHLLSGLAAILSFALITGAVGGTVGSLVGSGLRRVVTVRPTNQYQY